ncbi:TPA: GNAT family N-acetyltransferase [Yersinia enterocolitica]|nr:GNAT family N-acetyltransferase [Yersinia enterocolitica]HEM6616115.1 GNAT family N-acetyltransferase [Yersinia enterocolitica]
MIGNDKTSSIHIPDGMLATIYKNNDYSPPYFNLTESIGQHDLAGLYMDNRISGISVSNVPIEGCSEHCVIIKRRKLPLVDIFSQYWDDPTYPNKQVLLSFDINDKSDFMVELSLGPIIWFSKKEVIIFDSNNNEPLVFLIHPDANRFVLLFHLNNNNIAVDYMEGRGTEQIALSPTITLANAPFDRPIETSAIIINNTGESPQVIDQIVMTASAEDIQSVHHRSERDIAGTLGCAFIPALAIYNYVTHSRCNQGDTLWSKVTHWFSDKNKDKPVLVTANPTLLKPQPQQPENSGGAALVLTKIETQLHNQALTLPATAQFCKTSMENILAERYPRDVDVNCRQWVSRVLADFTLLFGDSLQNWTLDVLRRVLIQIHQDDTTGFATSDPAAESRLVNEVREAMIHLGSADEAIRQISQAFDYTRLNYARYLAHNPTATAYPSAAQRLPLGTYSLSLASYHSPTDRPAARVRENGVWVTHPDLYFDVDILDTTIPGQPEIDGPLMDDARAALAAWSDIYNAAPVNYYITNEYWSEHDRTIEAGRAHSYSLYSEMLASGNDYIYVAVRLRGDIVSLLAATRDESFENSHENYYVEFFVTDPNYVLMPEDEESVRGAGRAAVQGIAQYLQQRGVKTLRFRAISQPAARVSTKLGFHHDEF